MVQILQIMISRPGKKHMKFSLYFILIRVSALALRLLLEILQILLESRFDTQEHMYKLLTYLMILSIT